MSNKTIDTTPAPETDARGRMTFECWGSRKSAAAATLRQAQILHGWPDGKLLTEAQFDAAIGAASNLVFR